MADRRFFDRAGPFTLDALCALSGARLLHVKDGARVISDVAPLETAGPADVSFLENRKYIEAFIRSHAGGAFVDEKAAEQAPPSMALLVSKEPYKAYALAAQAFYPAPQVVARRATSAIVDATAIVPEDCDIGPNVVIERGVRLGRRCRVGANTVIGGGVEIGDDCRIDANVTLSHCVIGSGSMIDNLVQIGHNVVLGRCCILAGQVGISGSTSLDDFVMVGGQGGLAGHLHIGSGARIAAKSGLMRDVPAGETVCGSPAVPLSEFMRQTAVLHRLAKKKAGS